MEYIISFIITTYFIIAVSLLIQGVMIFKLYRKLSVSEETEKCFEEDEYQEVTEMGIPFDKTGIPKHNPLFIFMLVMGAIALIVGFSRWAIQNPDDFDRVFVPKIFSESKQQYARYIKSIEMGEIYIEEDVREYAISHGYPISRIDKVLPEGRKRHETILKHSESMTLNGYISITREDAKEFLVDDIAKAYSKTIRDNDVPATHECRIYMLNSLESLEFKKGKDVGGLTVTLEYYDSSLWWPYYRHGLVLSALCAMDAGGNVIIVKWEMESGILVINSIIIRTLKSV